MSIKYNNAGMPVFNTRAGGGDNLVNNNVSGDTVGKDYIAITPSYRVIGGRDSNIPFYGYHPPIEYYRGFGYLSGKKC